MAKRRRHRPGHGEVSEKKRQKISPTSKSSTSAVKHSVLEQFYPRVLTLREYLLTRLPTESKIRRKKVATAGTSKQASNGSHSLSEETAILVADVLDTTLVGIPDSKGDGGERGSKWNSYISTQMENSEITFLGDTASSAQSEIVDFTIWLLHAQPLVRGTWQKHFLAQGYRKGPSFRSTTSTTSHASIGGLHLVFRNQYVDMLKSSPWPEILRLLGKGGDLVMIDLLCDCALFARAEGGKGNYWQFSGMPLGDLKVLEPPRTVEAAMVKADAVAGGCASVTPAVKSPIAIQFVRNRMLYARPVLNSRGIVTFGLRHIHVLNRYPFPSIQNAKNAVDDQAQSYGKPDLNTLHVLMYMFPRQFGLHNVFTSVLDSRETVQPFKDYTVREEEIQARLRREPKIQVPKRLRAEALRLAQRLQVLHQRCPYDALLKYHCTREEETTFASSCETSQNTTRSSEGFRTQKSLSLPTQNPAQEEPREFEVRPKRLNVIEHATPTAKVSAFCRSVLSRIIPDHFWGIEEDQAHNKQVLLNNVDRFVKLRRFESMSLHDVIHGMKISNIPWLLHSNTSAKGSQSDTLKRQELFREFLYYIFDSLLIPLIRCNFHVTESSVHRYRIFFFRHDVWKGIAEPAMLQIKHNMFEEVDSTAARRLLDGRRLGFSQLRLLPKESGVRPIMNLRRRPLKKGSKMLGSSINSILAPVYNMLTFEKEQEPLKFGSTLFSVSDLYSKLKTFKECIGKFDKPFYISKVDVQSAFDTIPQEAVVRLVSSLPTSSKYHVSKHVEVKPADGQGLDAHAGKRAKPLRKWVSLANNKRDTYHFGAKVETAIGAKRKNTVFVGNVGEQTHNTDTLIKLLEEHVQQNLVKIGKKYYRQKNGIPQGSVISSLLCNYFYADLERQYLSFLNPENSLLLRLIDDFLLITTDPDHAKRFLQIMHNGVPQYGVTVNPSKTLVNFEVSINNLKLSRLVSSNQFPYCGTLINTKTLHISKNREGRNDSRIADSLTVEYSRLPGRTFQRKVLNTFKIQCHAMFIDTRHNSKMVVARNVYEIFVESANKMCAYDKCLPAGKRAGHMMVIRTVEALLEMAWVLMRSKGRNERERGFRCAIEKGEVRWLGWKAFETVLGRRQSRYGKVVEWVRKELDSMEERFRGRKVPV